MAEYTEQEIRTRLLEIEERLELEAELESTSAHRSLIAVMYAVGILGVIGSVLGLSLTLLDNTYFGWARNFYLANLGLSLMDLAVGFSLSIDQPRYPKRRRRRARWSDPND